MIKKTPASAAALDWDEPCVESLSACAAIQCDSQWLTNALNRRPVMFPLNPDERIQVGGRNFFLFKIRTVFHLALIRELSAVMPMAMARDLSGVCARSDFLFSGDGALGGPPRYLVIAPKSGESKMLVRSVGKPQPSLEELASVGRDPSEPRIVLNATAIFDRVVEALDVLEVAGELVG